MARSEFENSFARTVLPGAGGLIAVERIESSLYLIVDGRSVIGWSRTLAEAKALVSGHHEGVLAI